MGPKTGAIMAMGGLGSESRYSHMHCTAWGELCMQYTCTGMRGALCAWGRKLGTPQRDLRSTSTAGSVFAIALACARVPAMLGLDAQIEHWERVSAQCDGMTSNVCAKLDALDARLSSLAAALIPLHEETETLSYVQSNAAAALEEMDKCVCTHAGRLRAGAGGPPAQVSAARRIYKKYEDAEVIRDTLVKSRFPVQSDEFLQLLLDAKMLLDYFKQNSHNEGSDRTVTALRLSLRRAEKECRATLAAAIGNIPLQVHAVCSVHWPG